ncbi:MAG: hypothetical protein R3195_17910, partial [Gemmatimonadota bacterium]|nr:hypothetical protein [Gemmatimonadota bacterium]
MRTGQLTRFARFRRILLASIVLGVGVGATEAQEVAVVVRAREAQRDFEAVRRRHYVRDVMSDDRCDEHVGRFCLNHDGDDGWTPSPEDPRVAEERRRLLAALDDAAAARPDDPWIVGQRVKYLLEADRPGDALEAVHPDVACGGAPWWCTALRGFVLHSEGRWGEAEALFDEARAAMSDEQRCAWDDIEQLLDADDRKVYGDFSCGSPDRSAFEARFWHLADPWWAVPGYERRSEHFTRRVWAAIQTDAASGYGLSWGRDLEELTMRYGWPAGWDLAWRRIPGVRTERSVEAHRAPRAQRFAASDILG